VARVRAGNSSAEGESGSLIFMITSTHAIIYAEGADQARAFFRDTLEFPFVDAHGGWLIFKLPPAELGIHPAGQPDDPNSGAPSGRHELYLMCDDLEATVADLKAKGVEFTTPVEDQGFGLIIRLRVPGAGEIGLYQPKHATAYAIEE
jgi:catechol 2,3-dioxygenase-like lactoylglutathione lyase family enzyme